MTPDGADDRADPVRSVVCLMGDVDIVTAAAVARDLENAMAASDAGVIVDLSGVTFLDASGLRVLLQAQQQGGERLRLRGPSRPVTRLLELTGLVDAFSTHAGLRESAA